MKKICDRKDTVKESNKCSFRVCCILSGSDTAAEVKQLQWHYLLKVTLFKSSCQGEGEGRMIWENGIEICIISYMKRVASPGSMHDTGCLGLVRWDDPEGWYGEGGWRRVGWGTHVYPLQIHFDIWQNQYNIVKLNKIKKKLKKNKKG